MERRYLVVEGVIGAGKTTLARRLADTFSSDLVLEEPEDNPFLESFYRQGQPYALATQLHFLLQRIRQLRALRQGSLFRRVRIGDFLLEKDPLFARLNLTEEELLIYQQVYDSQPKDDLPQPDLVVVLQAPVEVLLQRIRQRNRHYEQRIERDYLLRLGEIYAEFFLHYEATPLLVVNTEHLDLVSDDQHYQWLLEQIDKVQAGRHYFNPVLE